MKLSSFFSYKNNFKKKNTYVNNENVKGIYVKNKLIFKLKNGKS